METYSYKCPICGYVHLVPGYWVSYDPPAELEQPQRRPRSGAAWWGPG